MQDAARPRLAAAARRGIDMKSRPSMLVWLGFGLALLFWLAESLIHTYVFGRGSLAFNLLGELDANELWMRLLIALSFVAFGWVAERSVRAERHLKEDANRLNRLLQFADYVRLKWPHPAQARADAHADQAAGASSAAAAPPAGRSNAPAPIDDLAVSDDQIGMLTRVLQDLSSLVEDRFDELHALLHLTDEINEGLLLDEILDKAYDSLQPVLPYNRLSVALLERDGSILRARWARADYSELRLRKGYAGAIKGSSLEAIIASGQPRIINDMAAYLRAHPASEATAIMVEEGIRSSLTCPLISIGKPVGFMFFSSLAPNMYEDAHVDLFKLIAGHLSVTVEKSNLYQAILRETEKSERLLLNVMPARIAARLRSGAKSIAENLPRINILFIDIVAFTVFASRYPPERVLNLLENVFVPLDRLCELYQVEKIKTSGDEYMAMNNASNSDGDEALARLAEYALEALKTVSGMRYPDGETVRIRVGMHTGPAVAGVLGQSKFAYDIWGDAVNVAKRMESSGEPGRIHVTDEVRAKLHQDFLFEERGTIEVKNKGPMQTHFLTGRR
jgi:class 3 adenylate cyclase